MRGGRSVARPHVQVARGRDHAAVPEQIACLDQVRPASQRQTRRRVPEEMRVDARESRSTPGFSGEIVDPRVGQGTRRRIIDNAPRNQPRFLRRRIASDWKWS